MEHLASEKVQLRSCFILRGRTQVYYIFPLPPDWETTEKKKWFSIIKCWLSESLKGTKRFVNPQTWAVGVGVGQNNQLGLVANKDLNVRAYTIRVEDLTVCLCLWDIRTICLLGLFKETASLAPSGRTQEWEGGGQVSGMGLPSCAPFSCRVTPWPRWPSPLLESIGSRTVTCGVLWEADNRAKGRALCEL